MADQVQANGPSSEKFIDSFNPDDPEYIREQQRPATIREDVREMERRKRVSLVLNSQAFREELEEIISSQLRQGPHPASLIALQQISELLPQGRLQQSFGSTAGGGGGGGGMGRGGMCNSILPISDIKPAEAARYMGGEKHLRCKLASLYRLVDMHGWSGLHTHITARVSQEQEHLLMNPYGYLYNEVTAASLVKVNLQGDMVDPGSTILGVNRDEFTLHQAVHSARPSIRCIVHLNTPAASAISAMKCGLQLLCIEAIMCGKVSYHEYRGAPVILDEADEIRHSLGPFSKLIFLRNHGFLALGETIEEAWFYARNAALACETQLNCLSYGGQELWQPSEETIEKLHDAAKSALVSEVVREGDREIRWGVGQREFEALMRWMDNAGYRTGYVYKQPIVKVERFNKRFEDVEVPPSATSVQEMLDDDAAGSPRAHKAMDVKKKQEKTKWLNAPASSTTTTQKVEVDETGKTVTTTTTTSSSSKIQGQEHVDGIVDQESHKPFQVYKQDYVEHPAEQMTEEERKKYEEEIQQQKDLMDSSLKAEEDQSPGSDEGAGAPDTPAPTLSRDRPMSERTPQHAGKPAVVDDDDDIGVRRTQSARTTKKKSSREPVDEGDDVKDKSATMRSTDSGEVSGRSSREGSPTKLGEKEKKKKKKKGFRTPSFLKGKKKDKHKDE